MYRTKSEFEYDVRQIACTVAYNRGLPIEVFEECIRERLRMTLPRLRATYLKVEYDDFLNDVRSEIEAYGNILMDCWADIRQSRQQN